MLEIKRRDFIKGSAALAGAASIAGGPVFNTLSKAVAAPDGTGGESPAVEWVKTVCQGCTTWCAAEAGVQTDPVSGVKRVVQVRGSQMFDADSGTTGAGLYHAGYVCPRGVLAIQEQYDPDRIKTPMLRTNPKKGRNEDPGFVPVSWPVAIAAVADKMLELRDNDETEKFFHIRGRYTDLNGILYGGLNNAFGSQNYTSHSTICAEAEKFGYLHTFGRFGYMDYDVDAADYVLLWGVDPTSSNRQVPANIHKTGDRLAAGTKYVSIDPRLNSLGAKAHHWLPVNPGTDGALALAIAHWVLVTNAWYKPFVGLDGAVFAAGVDADVTAAGPELGTLGLVDWWDLELKDRTPEWAEAICGIPAAQIKQVAAEAAAAAPHVISWVGPGCTMHPTAAYSGFAAAALNGLFGSCDNEGGVTWPASTGFSAGGISGSPAGFRDAIANAGYARSARRLDRGDTYGGPSVPLDMPAMTASLGGARVTNAFADGINNGVRDADGDLYSAKVVIGYWANFAFSCQGSQRWEEALKKVFYVDLGLNASETSWYADVVLPVPHHMFESWASISSHARKAAVYGMQRPAVEPMWGVRQAETEFVWMLAQEMADPARTNAWAGLKNWLAHADFDELLADPVLGTTPAAASTFTTPEQFHAAVVHKRIGLRNATTWGEFLADGLKYGVKTFDANGRGSRWLAAVSGVGTGFGTATGKFEFCNPANGNLKTNLNTHATNHAVDIAAVMDACKYDDTAQGVRDKGDAYAFIPHWEEPYIIGEESVYPFILVDAKSRMNREGRSANTPWYHEFKDNDPGDVKNSDVLKMNPGDVAALGLKDGQSIRITSPQTGPQGLLCRVKAWEGIAPGVVSKTFGNGHWAYGRHASALFGRIARGANNNELIPAVWESLTGSSARNACVRVKVTAV